MILLYEAAPFPDDDLKCLTLEYCLQEIWNSRVAQYWKLMKSEIQKYSFRNVMDMNANLGGFAASLRKKDVWVMNVVPFMESGKLKIIYDRGLIGTIHNW